MTNYNDTPLQFWTKHLGLVQQKYQQRLNHAECTNLDRTFPALFRRSSRSFSSLLLRATSESSWRSIPGLFLPIMASIAFWSWEMYWSSKWYWTISGTWLARRSEVIYKYIQSTLKFILNHGKKNQYLFQDSAANNLTSPCICDGRRWCVFDVKIFLLSQDRRQRQLQENQTYVFGKQFFQLLSGNSGKKITHRH